MDFWKIIYINGEEIYFTIYVYTFST